MTVAELLNELRNINQERFLAAHHDDMYFQTFADVDALDKVIILINFLAKKNPSENSFSHVNIEDIVGVLYRSREIEI